MTLSKSFISSLTGAVISLNGLLLDLTMTSMKNLMLQTHLNQTIIALNSTSMFQSLSLLHYTGLLGTLLTLTAHHLLLKFPVFQSFHQSIKFIFRSTCKKMNERVQSVEKANQFSNFLRTALISMRPFSAEGYNSSPFLETIRDELFIAKREIRQAERKWRNTKLTIFKDLYRQARHKVFEICAHS